MSMKYQNIHQDLINGCLKGDRKSQFEIYKLYNKAMFNISLRIVNDKMVAEDVMQEAFLSAFNKLKLYKGDVSFGAWLKKIVINKSIDVIKKKNPIYSELDSSYSENYTDNQEEKYEYSIDINSQVEIIKRTINDLPDGYRIVLSLSLLEGYDHDEIAQILNITSSTSRSQFARARKKLLQELKQKSIQDYEKN